MQRRLLLGAFILFLAAGCSGNKQASAPGPASSLANPIAFPLYSGSRVLASKDFTQTINNQSGQYNGVLMQGNGTYKGTEVIAESSASLSQLSSWLRSLDAHPPAHYQHYSSADLQTTINNGSALGLDYSAFQTTEGGKPVGLMVVVMDPSKLGKRLGPVLSLVNTYRSLPSMMRAPIDERFKAQTGISMTEALQPQSPLGLVLDSLQEFSHTNARAILLLDARKQ